MLKVIGAALVMAGTVGLGWRGVERLGERVEALRGLQGAVAYLEEELAFRFTPLPQLLEQLSQNRQGAVGAFFGNVRKKMERGDIPLRQGWRQAVEETLPMLKDEEQKTVAELGEVLGQYDAQTQVQTLKLTGERLAGSYMTAQEERSRLGKVYLALGVAGGLVTVLALI